MSQEASSRLPTRSLGRGSALVCPSCQGVDFVERSSFKTASEPVLGAASTGVIIDLMNCKRCGADLPAVRGRRSYTLISDKKLTGFLADLEEAQRINNELQALVDKTARRSHALGAEIERCKAQGEIKVMKERVAALEAETDGLEGRRARLAEVLESIATRMPAG